MIFLEHHWKIAKCVALGAVVLEALVFLLALITKAVNMPAEYDSDDEYIAPRYGIREPLIIGQGIPATGVPVHSTLDQHPSSTVAYIHRLREKYGLDSSMFTYNSSGPGRYQQAMVAPAEESGRCTML
ncbi:unnamed protein product [Musa acuminata subsp. malaccensis]|uniref:(wild Malaysian banana) hypothetical protein n=1 Tax=Musa acuminata subsp. malaccensis TaxID=214687 RepID=A0A804LAC7_MUSAM|nr:unnamed protein product [Musa acuminata subsp. malaccensis]